jgi:5-methylcytosine-specific restriction endonuclease McrA
MDALTNLICGDETPAKTKLVVNAVVDYATLMADAAPGTCEVAGLGTVSVETIKQWEGDRWLRLLVKDGVDIRTVTRTTRFIDQRQRAALLVRDGLTCCIEDCDRQALLQIDHEWQFSRGGPTELDNLRRPCSHHHHLKDVLGWKITGGPGHWRLEPP